MNKEFDFFIEENISRVRSWAHEKKLQGSIVVGNATQLIEYLKENTEPPDDLSCVISGAWLDQCIKSSVRTLLSSDTLKHLLPGRSISHVSVDLSTSVAFSERLTNLSIEERRNLLVSKIWPHAEDARLTILPEIRQPSE